MKPLRVFLFILSLFAVLSAAAVAAAAHLDAPPTEFSEDRVFAIEQGEPFGVVAERLQAERIIRSHLFFRFLAAMGGKEGEIKAGVYRFVGGSDSYAILQSIVKGKELLLKLTIPEGLTLSETARVFEAKGICSAESFIASASNAELLRELHIGAETAEGYLSPDTYYFPSVFSSDLVVAHLVKNFFVKLEKIYPSYRNLSREKLHEAVILASIVKREYRIPEEAALIASVFYNRLKTGMPLQSCATVAYILTEIKGKEHPERLFYQDLEIASPYNTYLHPGYPAGPICNPGETALRAAFNPAETDYLYFVLEDAEEGRHFFSRTLAEHTQAFSLYVRKR
jgi:UPF0755 protein